MSFAAVTDPFIPERVLFGLGMAFILIGTFLHWRLNHVAMSVEEDQKDRVITEEQARRRLTVAKFSGPLTISIGIVAWGLLLWE